MFMEGDKMFSIGEFSKMAKTTVKTLRHYDEIGLLAPDVTACLLHNDPTSYRHWRG